VDFLFRPAAYLGLAGRTVTFAEAREAAWQRGETALGFRLGPNAQSDADAVVLNPDRDAAWELTEAHDVIVLAGNRPA
jgi:hypothetical protein